MWGIEGKDWEMSPDGNPIFTYNTNDMDLQKQEAYRWWGLLIGSVVTEGLYNYNPKALSVPAMLEMKKHTVYDPAVGMIIPEADSRESAIQAKLDDMIKNEEVKILLAKSEEDAVKAYDHMLQLAEKIGLSELEAWANAKYQGVRSMFE
jgi:putative aldouronate transport system substrate-binding protein